MTDFRKAKCIELHDSNITLTTDEEHYAFTAPIGRTEHADKPAFSIKLCDIAMLAEMFKLNVLNNINVPSSSEQPLTSNKNEKIDYLQIPIYKNHYNATDDQANEDKITKIECKVASEHLVHIKITSKNEESSEEYIEEITYSGAFTIWWQKN